MDSETTFLLIGALFIGLLLMYIGRIVKLHEEIDGDAKRESQERGNQ